MSKLIVLRWLIIGLVMMNLLLVGLMVTHNPDRDRRDEPKRIIIERLGFDEQQINDYEKLIDWHRSKMRESREKTTQLKNQLYSTLNGKDTTVSTDSLMAEIGRVQQDMEHVHYQHFQDIRNLCRPDQLPAFDQLTTEIADLFTPPHEKR
jgi:hypothetical protein